MFYVLYFPYFECLTKEFDIQLFKNAGALARPHENTQADEQLEDILPQPSATHPMGV